MDAGVVGEFGVESRGHGSSLPDGHWVGAFGGEDFDAFAKVRNLWGTDEDHFQRRLVLLALEIEEELAVADRAVDLASVGIAANANVEGSEASLRGIFDLLGEKDGSGAGAEGWLEADELLQFFESGFAEKFEEGTGFASGDDEAVNLIKLLRLLDEHNFGAELFEPAAVGVKIALQGQNSNDHLLSKNLSTTGSQRNRGGASTRFNSSGYLATLMRLPAATVKR